VHQAYLPIVAASTRASTLHYCCNDKEFAWGPVEPHDHQNGNEFAHNETKELNPQVLLIDAGCEWNCYASDITRTMPVGNGGKFTPEAKAIYELVLEMQKVGLGGIVRMCFLTDIPADLVRHSETGFALGCCPSPLPSHPRQRLPATWNLQVPELSWQWLLELRGSDSSQRREHCILPAWSGPFVGYGCTRCAERQ